MADEPFVVDLAKIVELMATQKASIDKVQSLLDDVYPGLKATFTFNGIQVSGPSGQMARLARDFEAFEAKKAGVLPPKEH
jgi:hypothetical protein